MLKRKILGVLLGAIMMAGLVSVTDTMAASVVCPAGSKRAGEAVSGFAECNVENTGKELDQTARKMINVAIGVIGLVAVIVIVVGAFQYTVSQGDPSRIKKAKDTIMYGIIGMVLAILSFAIVNFVLTEFFIKK